MYNPYERDWLQFRSCYCFSVLKAWSCISGPLYWFLPAFRPRVIKLTPLLNGFLPVAFPWSQSVRETAPPSTNFPSWVEGSPRPLPDHHPIAFTSSCFEFTLLSFPSLPSLDVVTHQPCFFLDDIGDLASPLPQSPANLRWLFDTPPPYNFSVSLTLVIIALALLFTAFLYTGLLCDMPFKGLKY